MHDTQGFVWHHLFRPRTSCQMLARISNVVPWREYGNRWMLAHVAGNRTDQPVWSAPQLAGELERGHPRISSTSVSQFRYSTTQSSQQDVKGILHVISLIQLSGGLCYVHCCVQCREVTPEPGSAETGPVSAVAHPKGKVPDSPCPISPRWSVHKNETQRSRSRVRRQGKARDARDLKLDTRAVTS